MERSKSGDEERVGKETTSAELVRPPFLFVSRLEVELSFNGGGVSLSLSVHLAPLVLRLWVFFSTQEEKKPEEKKVEEAKEEPKKPEGEEKKKEEGKKEGDGGEKKEGEGEKKESPPPPPPEEIVMRVFMHCEGCARKVKRSLKGFPGYPSSLSNCLSLRFLATEH